LKGDLVSDAKRPDPESILRAEVDRAVAPYVGVAPPAMLAKMRELAERYYRTHPQAARILHVLEQRQRVRSGMEPTGEGAADAPAAQDRKKG
jgi:hypothetical protein